MEQRINIKLYLNWVKLLQTSKKYWNKYMENKHYSVHALLNGLAVFVTTVKLIQPSTEVHYDRWELLRYILNGYISDIAFSASVLEINSLTLYILLHVLLWKLFLSYERKIIISSFCFYPGWWNNFCRFEKLFTSFKFSCILLKKDHLIDSYVNVLFKSY